MQRPDASSGADEAAAAAAARVEARRHNFISCLILAAQNGFGRDVEPFLALCHETWGEEVLWDAVKDLPHGKLALELDAQRSGAGHVWQQSASGGWEIAKHALNVAADPFGKKRTRLMYVAQAGNVARLRWLLARGARLELKDWKGRSALYWACFAGRVDTARELLARGAAVGAADHDGCTPLHLASEAGLVGLVRELLARGAAVNAAGRDGAPPPLLIASKGGHWEVVRALLDWGAAVDAADKDGATLLHLASEAGLVGPVRELLVRGAAVNAPMRDGATPLHAASQRGHLEVAFELLQRGASLTAAHNGRTPLDVAATAAVSHALSTAQLICGRGATREEACRELRRYAEGRLTAAGQLPLALLEEEARRMGEEAGRPRPPMARRGDAEEAALLAAAIAASLRDARGAAAGGGTARGEEFEFEEEE